MLKKSEKEQAITELHDKLTKAVVAIVATPKDINVATITDLRKKFRAQKVEYKVVKNTLAKRAAKGTAAEVLNDLFEGPCAIIMGYEDPISPAKMLQDFIEKSKGKMEIRGAVLEGKKLAAKDVEALSKMPGVPELRAMLLGIINKPAQLLVSILNQPQSGLARVIDAHREAEAKKA
ncbi:MAG: 50S ribosomal protein L10 [Myxococcales bacterium]